MIHTHHTKMCEYLMNKFCQASRHAPTHRFNLRNEIFACFATWLVCAGRGLFFATWRIHAIVCGVRELCDFLSQAVSFYTFFSAIGKMTLRYLFTPHHARPCLTPHFMLTRPHFMLTRRLLRGLYDFHAALDVHMFVCCRPSKRRMYQ
jgi:hypothetical protein